MEISGDDDEAEEKELKRLKEQDEQRAKVGRLRIKVLMRRAKAKSQIGGWANLQGAAEDYQLLDKMKDLSWMTSALFSAPSENYPTRSRSRGKRRWVK